MPDSGRTFWKGHLRLALVSIPVRLVTAERAASEIRFHQVDKISKQRIRYMKVAPGRGEVPKEDIVSAYEFEPGNYVFMEEEELDQLKLSSRHTIELSRFVDADEIDPLYFDRPYFLLPDGEVAEEGYRVVRDALFASHKVGIGQLALRGRENLVALFPDVEGRGLIVQTLRYQNELKDAGEIFSSLGKETPRADMVRMAEDLIKARSEPFDPSMFKNHYAQAVRELVQAKLNKGENVPVEEHVERGAKVLDFMEALKRSVGATRGAETNEEAARDGRESARRTEEPPRKATSKSASRAPAKKASRPAKRRA